MSDIPARWWAALAAVVMLSACTGTGTEAPAPAASTSAKPSAPKEQTPAGHYRPAKDGELCKKMDVAALQALVPGLALGPGTGVNNNILGCNLTASKPSFVNVGIGVTMHATADEARKVHDAALNELSGWQKVTLATTKAEAKMAKGPSKELLVLVDQNMTLSAGWFSTDKTLLTEKFAAAVQQAVDSLLAVLRKELQSTT